MDQPITFAEVLVVCAFGALVLLSLSLGVLAFFAAPVEAPRNRKVQARKTVRLSWWQRKQLRNRRLS